LGVPKQKITSLMQPKCLKLVAKKPEMLVFKRIQQNIKILILLPANQLIEVKVSFRVCLWIS
jgi:hypothetical protein